MKKILLTSAGFENKNIENNLGFIKNTINVHCEKASKNGTIVNDNEISLTNNQAIYINDDEMVIFE